MAHRLNLVLDDETWKELMRIPASEHNQLLNHVTAEWLKASRRTWIARKMNALRDTMQAISTKEIAAWLREDRGHRW